MEHVIRHKKTLGILFICFAALQLVIFTLGVQLVSMGLHFLEEEAELKFAAYLLKYVIGTVMLLYAVPSLLAGIGLINGKRWAIVLALILGIISLPVFPIGTGIGAYAIIVFLMDQSSYYNKPEAGNIKQEQEEEKQNEVSSI